MPQNSLFPESDDDLAPQAARLAPKLRALAERRIYFGTSSWRYEGWIGSIYSAERYKTRGKHSKAKFERECLAEYARVFPTVCGDFAFYQFPTREYWDDLFAQAPADFTFGLKVPEDITVAKWPGHARYGNRAGEVNEHFLDAAAFRTYFARRLEPHSGRLGPLIFEFGSFNKATFPNPGDFYGRLESFLLALPHRTTGALALFLTTGGALTYRLQQLDKAFGNDLAFLLRDHPAWLPRRFEHGIVAVSHHVFLFVAIVLATWLLSWIISELSETTPSK